MTYARALRDSDRHPNGRRPQGSVAEGDRARAEGIAPKPLYLNPEPSMTKTGEIPPEDLRSRVMPLSVGDGFAATRFRPSDRAPSGLAATRFNRAQGCGA
jgi:hypothetical protein